jgi:hypothetical protein
MSASNTGESPRTPEEVAIDAWYDRNPLTPLQLQALADKLPTDVLFEALRRRGELAPGIGATALQAAQGPQLEDIPPQKTAEPLSREATPQTATSPEERAQLRKFAEAYVNPNIRLHAAQQWYGMTAIWRHLGYALPDLSLKHKGLFQNVIEKDPSLRIVVAPLFDAKANIGELRTAVMESAYELAGIGEDEADSGSNIDEEYDDPDEGDEDYGEDDEEEESSDGSGEVEKTPYEQLIEHPMQRVDVNKSTSYYLRYRGPDGSQMSRQGYLEAMEKSGHAIKDVKGMLWTVSIMSIQQNTQSCEIPGNAAFHAQTAMMTPETLMTAQLMHVIAGSPAGQGYPTYIANEAVFAATRDAKGRTVLEDRPTAVAAVVVYPKDYIIMQGLQVTSKRERYNVRPIVADLAGPAHRAQ